MFPSLIKDRGYTDTYSVFNSLLQGLNMIHYLMLGLVTEVATWVLIPSLHKLGQEATSKQELKMKITKILSESERNKFPDPRQHIRKAKSSFPNWDESQHADWHISIAGQAILGTLRTGGFQSTITVKTLFSFYEKRFKTDPKLELPLYMSVYSLGKPAFLSAIKFLANDGFIKLSSCAQFEKRRILQYHATAEPKFQSGKFEVWNIKLNTSPF